MIEPLLKAHFPAMEGETSDAWHVFLNAETGLDVALDEPNPSAFDRWRQALSAKGLPVWGISPERQAAIDERVAAMREGERKRLADQADRLAALKLEAPLVTVKDLLK
jgi:hypothetical protein